MQEKSQSCSLELFLSPHPLCIEIYWTSSKSLSPPGNCFLFCYKTYCFGSLGVTYPSCDSRRLLCREGDGGLWSQPVHCPTFGACSSPHAPWSLSVSSCLILLTESVTVVFLSSSLPRSLPPTLRSSFPFFSCLTVHPHQWPQPVVLMETPLFPVSLGYWLHPLRPDLRLNWWPGWRLGGFLSLCVLF